MSGKVRAKLGLKKKKDESIRVFVRIRPLFGREIKAGNKSVVKVTHKKGSVTITKPESGEPPKVFTYDATFDHTNTQRDIYDQGAAIIVDGVLSGYNGTVFAYGQTGAGKSHTMQGPASRKDDPSLNGIIPNSFDHIFEHIAANGSDKQKFMIQASYLEIYNEEVRDLLGKDPLKKLPVKSSPKKGIFVQGLSRHTVSNVADIDRVQNMGEKNRSVGSTNMNAVRPPANAQMLPMTMAENRDDMC